MKGHLRVFLTGYVSFSLRKEMRWHNVPWFGSRHVSTLIKMSLYLLMGGKEGKSEGPETF